MHQPWSFTVQSDDVYQRAFDAAVLQLEAWGDAHRDAATIDCERARDHVRLRVLPKAAGACPIELMLHRRTQACDLQIGAYFWDGVSAVDLEPIIPLLDAVVAGRVLFRRLRAAASGLLLNTEAEIMLADGRRLLFERPEKISSHLRGAPATAEQSSMLPYRRPVAPSN